MPLPTPNAGETAGEFISRCMADEVMVNDFPENDQRYAVCQNQLTEKTIADEIQKLIDKLK